MSDFMGKKFTVIVGKDVDGWLVADVPELAGCHTQAKNINELMKRTREVISLCLEEKEPYSNTKFVGVQTIEV
ncbi:MAG TPA: type II toxin-antitoxin system HicB family antitoxin [archaeon]|nr:type II toxin-antitoxin system HicB family antitoxin [archaeon]